ncbi:hypothetical protein ACMD2_05574, partial [Ananas comosus]
ELFGYKKGFAKHFLFLSFPTLRLEPRPFLLTYKYAKGTRNEKHSKRGKIWVGENPRTLLIELRRSTLEARSKVTILLRSL